MIAAWCDAPDLILFDPVLRDIPDKEFIQKLGNDPRSSTVPLVALSGDCSPFRRQTCLSAGVIGGKFAFANNLDQPMTIKYPTDTDSVIVESMVRIW